jgi:oxygen-independent coproporphyrinogen-3 oxidase
MKELGLYLHIPFCKVKCVYCDFYSIPGREASIPRFLELLMEEIELTLAEYDLSEYSVETVFLGGGTPSLLTAQQVTHILNFISKHFSVASDVEISLEANPGELSLQQLHSFKAEGINRISLGVQSLHQEHLTFMSRIHTPDQALQAVEWVRQAGFENLNTDLIFAIPHQSMDQWALDLGRILALRPEHIATYSLTVEEGTALARWVASGHVQVLEEIEDLVMYEYTLKTMAEHGYETYEISNHALPGRQCQHNLGYWLGHEYLSFGPSAHSYFHGQRWWNQRSLDRYLDSLSHGELPRDGAEDIDALTARRDYLMTRLRLTRGFEPAEYERKFGSNFQNDHAQAVKRWTPDYLSVAEERVGLTYKGLAVANEILIDLM